MNKNRRNFLQKGKNLTLLTLALAYGVDLKALAAEWNKDAFASLGLDNVLKALGGQGAKESAEIEVTVPEIAENGAVVPITILARLPKTQWIALLVEKNPNTLAAQFEIPDGTDPYITTRVRMRQTAKVIALVKADNQYFFAGREVKVTVGGCG